MGWWYKGNQIKQPPIVVEIDHTVRSIELNGEKYIHYGDVVNFMLDEKLDPEARWALDRAVWGMIKET